MFAGFSALNESSNADSDFENEKFEIAESHTKTAGHGKNISLWPISAPVKRSAGKEKAKLSCSWHPKNSSLNCHSRISWQQTKNEISENEEKEQFGEIKVSKVNLKGSRKGCAF